MREDPELDNLAVFTTLNVKDFTVKAMDKDYISFHCKSRSGKPVYPLSC